MARLLIILPFLFISAAAQVKYKLCVPFDKPTECANLNRADSEVSCVKVNDTTDCALKMIRGEVDFGKFSAEQALVASYFLPENGLNKALTIGETRNEDMISREFAFTAVAIVNTTNITGDSLAGKTGLKLCHPGMGLKNSGWSDLVLKEFDLKAASSVPEGLRCDSWRSDLENEYISINKFWGPSCRPGQWASDETMDKTLKSQFESLCSLCPNNKTCSYGPDSFSDPHKAALACLRDATNPGDVAFVDEFYAQDIIQSMNSSGSTFSLVCQDLRFGKSVSTCHWARQSWDSIIARAEKSKALAPKLIEWLKPVSPRQLGVDESASRAQDDWLRALADILLEDYQDYVGISETPVKTHISRGRNIPILKETHTCSGPSKWCTLQGLEYKKCEWMATASLVAGIVPPIQCLAAESNLACARRIGDHSADITVTNIDDAHIASMWEPELSGLPIRVDANKYLETSSDLNRHIVAMVRSGSTIHNSTDTKGRKMCFPVIDGLAYGVFLRDTMLPEKLPGDCPYPAAVNKYVGDSCFPGANEYNIALCELCKENVGNLNPMPNQCAASYGNLHYNDTGALRCLYSGGGEIAYVDLANARQTLDLGLISGASPNSFKVLCGTGQIEPHSGTFGGAEACSLIEVPAGAALCRASLEPHSARDVHNVLYSVDSLFGLGDSPATFHIYDSFNGTAGLIFLEGTVGLLASDSKIPAVTNYISMHAHVPKPCGSGGYSAGPSSASPSMTLSIIALLSVLCAKYRFILQ